MLRGPLITICVALVAVWLVACGDGGTGASGGDDSGGGSAGAGGRAGDATLDVSGGVDATVDPDVGPEPDGQIGGADVAPGDGHDGLAGTDDGGSGLPDASGDADAGPGEDPIPEPDVIPSFGNCSEPGGSRNIYDLQDPQCPDHITPAPIGSPGVYVALEGVVVSAAYGDTMFVQEPDGGPYSGIAVFTHGLPTFELLAGDVVDLTGYFSEFYDASQIYLDDWTVAASGGPAPPPFEIAHPSHIATNGALAEMFEGVYVRVSDVETIHTKPDCPHEFGEFVITGGLRVDDMGFHWDPHLGDTFAWIRAPLHYAFGNYKLEPRTVSDVEVLTVGPTTGLSKCIESDCIESATKPVSRAVVVNEMMVDPYGDDTVQEWIELYNTTDEPIPIDGWTLRDCAEQELPLIGANLVIPPGDFFVLGVKADPLFNGGVPVDHAIGQGFYLANTVGAVLLYDAAGVLVDQTRYSAYEPWDVLKLGASLERVDPESDGTLPESWAAATHKFGPTENLGTPGQPNAAAQ